MTRPPFRTSSSRYVRAFLSRKSVLNLSKLPKLPDGTPPLISRRSTPGDFDHGITFKQSLKAVDDDFARAVRLEASAEKKSGGKVSQSVTRFPSVTLSSLDIRMIPKKMLVAKDQKPSPILSKNPRKERSDLSLVVISPKATVHRFAVVRVRIKRRILGALDLIIRRGAFPYPKSELRQLSKPREFEVKDHRLDSGKPSVLLHHPTLGGPQAWILPDWTYIVYPKAEVFRMPLPDLVDQLRSGLQKVNRKAGLWQDQYVSPETGEFMPLLSKVLGPHSAPGPSGSKFQPGERNGRTSTVRQFRRSSQYSPDTWGAPPNARTYSYNS